MAFDYDPIAATAVRLLAHFGTDAIIRTPVTRGVPETGEVIQYKPIEATTRAVVVGINSDNSPTTIEEGDRMALVADRITPRDLLIIAGQSWQVVRVEVVQPGPTPLLYRAQVRQ